MSTPPIDLTRTNSQWIRVQSRGGVWANLPRRSILNAIHNTTIGTDPTALFLGWKVDETGCQAMLAAMDGGRS